MTATVTAEYFERRGCMPQQAAFAARFFSSDTPRVAVLVSPPGSGKGFTAAEICSYTMTSGQADRVLVITDRRALATHFEELLRGRDKDLPVFTIDRQKYWELESRAANGTDPWPTRGIIVIAADDLAYEDVRASLMRGGWGLIVLDSIDDFSEGADDHALALAQVGNTRLLCLGHTVPDFLSRPADSSSAVGIAASPLSSAAFVWNLLAGRLIRTLSTGELKQPPLVSHMTDSEQQQDPETGPTRSIRWIPYERNPDERALFSRLHQMLATLHNTPPTRRIAQVLCQSASSSAYALEDYVRALRHERNLVAHGQKPISEESLEAFGTLAPLLPELSSLIEAVAVDSKLMALCDALRAHPTPSPGRVAACIFARFMTTVDYLKSSLGSRFENVFVLNSRMSFDARIETVAACAAANGILVLTAAVTVEPFPTSLVVLYDLPSDPAILAARVAQFAKANQGETPDVMAFEDATASLAIEVVEREALKAGRRPMQTDVLAAALPAAAKSTSATPAQKTLFE